MKVGLRVGGGRGGRGWIGRLVDGWWVRGWVKV